MKGDENAAEEAKRLTQLERDIDRAKRAMACAWEDGDTYHADYWRTEVARLEAISDAMLKQSEVGR